MPRVRICCALALALAGCGERAAGERPAGARPPDPRAAAAELAARCGLLGPRPGRVDPVVPDGLLPAGAYVVQARRTGSAARATVLLPLGLADALDHIGRAAARAGHRVMFRENEVVDGEIYLGTAAGLVKFRLYASPRCGDTSQATFERTYLSD